MPTKEENKMGKWGATSYIIGNIVGSGIFITPTSILNNASSVGVSLIIWVLSAAIATLGAYCYVELGTSIRKSGADFAYLCHVKWMSIAFAFMSTGCLMTYPATLAVQAETFSEYIVQGLEIKFCDEWVLYVCRKLIGFSIIWSLLFLNFFSVRTFVARFQIAASIAKLVATGIIIVTGAYFLFIKGETQNLRDPFANSTLDPGKIANAFFAGLFSYDGWDILNFGAEELENPKRLMSFAILVGMSSVAVIFLCVNISFFTVLSVPEMQRSNAVAMTFAQRTLGSFQYLMPFLVSILLIGSLNGTLFSASRYLFAAARERQFPAFISCINVKHDSPRAALFTHVALAMGFSFLGNLDELIGYLGFSQWILRSFTMAALLYIRIWKLPVHPDAVRTPLVLPIFFMIICVALVVVTVVQSFKTASVALLFTALGFAVYCIFIWEKALPRFQWYQRWAARVNNSICAVFQITFNGIADLADGDGDEDGDKNLETSSANHRVFPIVESDQHNKDENDVQQWPRYQQSLRFDETPKKGL